MVLVDTDAVKAQLVGVGEGVDVLAVEVVSLDGIVEAIGHPDPGRVVLGVKVRRQVRPRHQVEEVVLHIGLRPGNPGATGGERGGILRGPSLGVPVTAQRWYYPGTK